MTSPAPARSLRRIVVVLIVLQVLIPAVMLVVRWTDPPLGQLRFGWQMHTLCWGSEELCS